MPGHCPQPRPYPMPGPPRGHGRAPGPTGRWTHIFTRKSTRRLVSLSILARSGFLADSASIRAAMVRCICTRNSAGVGASALAVVTFLSAGGLAFLPSWARPAGVTLHKSVTVSTSISFLIAKILPYRRRRPASLARGCWPDRHILASPAVSVARLFPASLAGQRKATRAANRRTPHTRAPSLRRVRRANRAVAFGPIQRSKMQLRCQINADRTPGAWSNVCLPRACRP